MDRRKAGAARTSSSVSRWSISERDGVERPESVGNPRPVELGRAGGAVVEDTAHIVDVRADKAVAQLLEPVLMRHEPEPIEHLGVAGVVPVPSLVGGEAVEEGEGLVGEGDVVELEAVLQPDHDAVGARRLHKLLQRRPRRFEMCGGCLRAARLHLPARLGGAVALDPRLPVEAIQLGLIARPGHLDFAQVHDQRRGARLGGPFDAAEGVLDRLGVLPRVGRRQVELGVAPSA